MPFTIISKNSSVGLWYQAELTLYNSLVVSHFLYDFKTKTKQKMKKRQRRQCKRLLPNHNLLVCTLLRVHTCTRVLLVTILRDTPCVRDLGALFGHEIKQAIFTWIWWTPTCWNTDHVKNVMSVQFVYPRNKKSLEAGAKKKKKVKRKDQEIKNKEWSILHSYSRNCLKRSQDYNHIGRAGMVE